MYLKKYYQYPGDRRHRLFIFLNHPVPMFDIVFCFWFTTFFKVWCCYRKSIIKRKQHFWASSSRMKRHLRRVRMLCRFLLFFSIFVLFFLFSRLFKKNYFCLASWQYKVFFLLWFRWLAKVVKNVFLPSVFRFSFLFFFFLSVSGDFDYC